MGHIRKRHDYFYQVIPVEDKFKWVILNSNKKDREVLQESDELYDTENDAEFDATWAIDHHYDYYD